MVDFSFRSIPHKVKEGGHYAFGGRVEVNFKSTQRQAATALRLSLISDAIKHDQQILFEEIDNLLNENLYDWLTAGVHKLIQTGKSLWDAITSLLATFYNNILVKLINLLSEYAALGFKKLVEMLGYEIEG